MTMTMRRLAYFAVLAKASPRDAARAFLLEAPEGVVVQLMDAAGWKDPDIQDFETRKMTVLISGRWGLFWLASPLFDRALVPPAPRLAPSGIVALARGVVDELLNEPTILQGAA